MRHIPNAICFLRLFLTFPCALLIVRGEFPLALFLFWVAGITDFFDGYFARRWHYGTPFGAILDPIADKVLMGGVFIALGVAEAIPWWLVVMVFGRDLFILAGAALLYGRIRQRKFPPTMAGKVSTAIQILSALAVLGVKAAFLPAFFIPTAIAFTTAGTLVSGFDYLRRSLQPTA